MEIINARISSNEDVRLTHEITRIRTAILQGTPQGIPDIRGMNRNYTINARRIILNTIEAATQERREILRGVIGRKPVRRHKFTRKRKRRSRKN